MENGTLIKANGSGKIDEKGSFLYRVMGRCNITNGDSYLHPNGTNIVRAIKKNAFYKSRGSNKTIVKRVELILLSIMLSILQNHETSSHVAIEDSAEWDDDDIFAESLRLKA